MEAELRALEGNTGKTRKSSSDLVNRLDTVVAGLDDMGESDEEDKELSEGKRRSFWESCRYGMGQKSLRSVCVERL